MKANRNSKFAPVLLITLNGKNMVETGKCIGANEDTGEVLMIYQNARGDEVDVWDAENNALIVDDRQAIVLKGEVKIGVSNPALCMEFFQYETEEALLEAIGASWSPVAVQKKIPVPCHDQRCKSPHWGLQPAFHF